MKASETRFLAFLKKATQCRIPIYQRTYSWGRTECEKLWLDILKAGQNKNSESHFIGSIVYIADGLSQVSHDAPALVIDGQQRLTTLTLMLAALAESLPDEDEPLDGFTKRKIKAYYLINSEESGERHYKLILTKTDKSTLISILNESEKHGNLSLRVSENFELFKEKISKLSPEELECLCKGITKLMIVDVALDRSHDNPQLIFESMNSTGKELSQADLIRNFVLMGLKPRIQTRLYEHYWNPMELEFGQQAYSTEFDKFMRHYLTVQTGDIPRRGDVYTAFKNYAAAEIARAQDDVNVANNARQNGIPEIQFDKDTVTEEFLKTLLKNAKYYCAFALGKESNQSLLYAFADIRELKVETAYPLMLELYSDYADNIISRIEFLELLRIIESYVFRRVVCQIPTNSMNKTFSNFAKQIVKDSYVESAKAHILMLPSYRRFPKNDEFLRELKTRDLYNNQRRSYWLRRLENDNRKERVIVDDYTIEHILPQNENLSSAWREDLGENWKEVQEKYLHTLGNLTLTGYNSEYSDNPFPKKRDMEGGFASSPLRVNEGLGQLEDWNEIEINNRATRLAQRMQSIWPIPTLPKETLQKYQEERETLTGYSYSDHAHLSKPHISDLLKSFKREVLALDPGIYEDIFKLYIAYKAEYNFVDVVPQASGLRLALNMKFPEINDPKGLCLDVTNKGRWGNGDVEVKLETLDQLPYVMGLVRQSLEKQLGESTVS